MKTVLIIHQSADLYGSDRHILNLIDYNIEKKRFKFIVLLPKKGPLYEELKKRQIDTEVVSLVLLSRGFGTNIFSIPFKVIRSIKSINNVVGNKEIDLVHSNTLAVFSGAIWSLLRKKPHLWNVHEMIMKPWLVRKIYPILLYFLSDIIVCNSRATMGILTSQFNLLKSKTLVILNGLDRPKKVGYDIYYNLRDELNLSNKEIIICLVGRINRWKGQKLFVTIAEKLINKGYKNLCFLIVGSSPANKSFYTKDLKRRITSSIAKQYFRILNFRRNIWEIWDNIDIAIVPSIEPEPFGFVALEAMLCSKPVVAANHGGLAEIVMDGITGFLVEPNDANQFTVKIEELINDRFLLAKFGREGQKRGLQNFAVKNCIRKYFQIYIKTIRKNET